MINSGYSHISEPAQELHSRARQVLDAPSPLSQSNHREKSLRKAEEKKNPKAEHKCTNIFFLEVQLLSNQEAYGIRCSLTNSNS